MDPIPHLRRPSDGIHAIRQAIAAGDVYQVNHTFRMRANFEGDPRGLFEHLRRAQAPCYATDINLGRFRILSASPELFFRRDGDKIITRPMKGTRPRGRWPEEDARFAEELRTSPKDRAENVMIVDLLRNDLGKIARTGTLPSPNLFQIERYPTVWQMTSEVTAEIDETVTVDDIFTALFPCGSVTGAPKVAAMRQIAALEDQPRGVYCGAIGYIPPSGRAVFSVANRTLTIDTETHTPPSTASAEVFTWALTADSEYDEALSKANLLTAETPEVLPVETASSYGRYRLRHRHVHRLLKSAAYFGFPVSRTEVDAALDAHAQKWPLGDLRVRLLVNNAGDIYMNILVFGKLQEGPYFVALADTPVSSQNIFLYHKTTHRAIYDHHRAGKLRHGADVLLYNERGELTEFTSAYW